MFLGNYSAESLGDYMAGPNHVLPTIHTARFFSPLSVYDFIKRTSIIYFDKNAFDRIGKNVSQFARSEGLTAHALAAEVRMEKQINIDYFQLQAKIRLHRILAENIIIAYRYK